MLQAKRFHLLLYAASFRGMVSQERRCNKLLYRGGAGGSAEEVGSGLHYQSSPVGGQQGRTDMVGHEDGSLEREDYLDDGYGVDHRVRYFNPGGLGSNVRAYPG